MANDEKFAVGLSSGSSPRRQITSASFSLRTRGHCQRRPRTHSKYLVVFAAVGDRKRKSSRDFAGFRAKPHGDGESKARPSRALVAPALGRAEASTIPGRHRWFRDISSIPVSRRRRGPRLLMRDGTKAARHHPLVSQSLSPGQRHTTHYGQFVGAEKRGRNVGKK